MANKYGGKTLDNGLFYTDSDILCSYKEAKDKRAQMKILADMNLCTTEDIRAALIRAGIDGRALPRKSKNDVTKEEVVENTQPDNSKETVTETARQESPVEEVVENIQPDKIDENVVETTKPDIHDEEVIDTPVMEESSVDVLELAHSAITTYQNMMLKQKKALEKEISNLESRVSKFKETLAKCENELSLINKLLSQEK